MKLSDITQEGLGWTALEKLFLHGLGFVQSVILARLLCPEDFGLAAMLGLFLCVGNLLAESGLGTAYVVYGFGGRQMLKWNVGAGLAIYAVLAIGAPWIASFYAQPILAPLLWTMGAGVVVNAACVLDNARLQRSQRFAALSIVNCLASVLSCVVAVVLAWQGCGVWSIAIMGVSWGVVRWMALRIAVVMTEGGTDSSASDCMHNTGESFRTMLEYGWKLTLSGLIHVIYLNSFQLIIGKMFSPAAVGLFMRGQRWAALPTDIVNEAVGRVALPNLAEGRGSARRYLLVNAAALWVASGALWTFAPEVVELVLGEQWLDCVPYLRILIVGVSFTPFTNMALTVIKAGGDAGVVLKTDVIKKPIAFAFLGIGVFGGIIGLCWAKVASDFVEMVVDLYYALQVRRHPRGPIDLVYCWCSGKAFAGREKCRFSDNGELYYSIKSVDRYAPWFRTIWIFANDGTEIPDWLSRHPKVKIVFHSQVIPQDVLPLYNSMSIELWLHCIPGLSERFVYSNDDMFLGRSVTPDDFFTRDGKMVCRYERNMMRVVGSYGRSLLHCRELMRRQKDAELSTEWTKAENHAPHHNMDGYLKSVIGDFADHFPEAFREARRLRERGGSQLQREVFSLWAMATGKGVYRCVVRGLCSRALNALGVRLLGPSVESLMYRLDQVDGVGWIERYRPKFFCLNDSEDATDEQRLAVRQWLERRFA